MSSAEQYRVRYSAKASVDIEDIRLEGLARWYEAQSRTYDVLLRTEIEKLSGFPLLGRRRDEVQPGLRSLVVRHHVIFYRIEDGFVVIVRILHESRQADDHLDRG